MVKYVTFDTDVRLAEKLIRVEVIHLGVGSPNKNGQLFVVQTITHMFVEEKVLNTEKYV